MEHKYKKLFYAGLEDVRSYRIPSLVLTKRGTLIAAADARLTEGQDNPNRIDKVVRRSFDKGRTWEKPIYALRMQGEGKSGSAAIDPCMLYDEETERIWMLFCASPAGIGLPNANSGSGFDEQGRKLLLDREDRRYYLENGNIYETDGRKTDFSVTEAGDIVTGKKREGNIFLSNAVFREVPTCYLRLIYSDDEGATWSAPLDITHQVKKEWMCFLGPGPGIGVVKKSQPHAGDYVFPVYYSNGYGVLSCAALYSGDGGKHWEIGESPNDSRCAEGSRLLLNQQHSLQEMQMAELEDGRLRAFIRNTMPDRHVCYADSMDGGRTWDIPKPCDFLPNPVCMTSVIRLWGEGNRIVFANPQNQSTRVQGTLLLSEDGGLSAVGEYRITEGGFAYSAIVQLGENQIGLLYEADNGTATVEEMRFLVLYLSEIPRR